MPDQLTVALRGLIKANLIHHLAHTGGAETILRIGRAAKTGWDWLPDEGEGDSLRRLCLIPTGKLKEEDLAGVRSPVGRGLNYLRLWGQGCFERARACFDEAIEIRPGWAGGYLLRGEAARSMLDYAGALADYDRALDLDPSFAWAYAFKARVLFQKGTRAQDLRLMDKAIALEPDAGWMYAWRAESFRRLGRFKEAQRDFKKAFKLDPLYDQAYGWKARMLVAQGKHASAVSCLKKGIALCPDFEKAYRQLVRAYRGAGLAREAVKTLDRAAALNHRNNWLGNWRVEGLPDDEAAAQALAELPKGSSWRGETLCQIGRLEEALKELDAVKKTSWVYAWRGECLLRLGRRDAALADLDKAVALDPGYGRAFVWRGRAKALARDWAGAVADFDAAMAFRRVEYSWINGWRGQAKLELGRFAEAVKDLDEAILLDPHCAMFYLWRGKAKVKLGDPTGGRLDLLKAQGDPAPRAQADVAEAFRAEKRYPEAKGLLDDAVLRHGGKHPWLYLLRHRLKREAGFPGAARDVDVAFRRDPACWKEVLHGDDSGWAALYAYRGQDRLKRGLAREGLEDLRRAAALEREGWILAWLGEAERKADPAKAVELLTEALRADPDYWNAYAWRATARLALGDAALAIEDLDVAVRRRPTARAYRDRSRAKLMLGLRLEAVSDFNEALRLNGELEWDDALGPWRKAAALHPKEAWFMAWRAETLPVRARKTCLKKALRLDPRYQRTYELLAGLSDTREALDLLSKAIKYNPYSARLYRQRAELSGSRADRARAQSLSPAPWKSLEFFVNYSCNAKCPFCFNPPDASAELERGLPFSELSRKMYVGYHDGYRAIKFIGGEVTIREDLPKILGLARRIGFKSIQITTNGIRLADPAYARRLVALGADSFRFSIHGHTPALHDRLVAVPGALEKIEKAVATLRPLGVKLGINYVLNRLNFEAFPETLRYFHKTLGIDDVIVYFLRFQGFGALPQNKELLKLKMSEAVPFVREAFRTMSGKPPALIHFPPCVMPELAAHMLDWTKDKDEDLVTSPDGKTAPIHDVTNSGKRSIAACAGCVHANRCLGVEANYLDLYGDAEFKTVRETSLAS